MGEAKEPVDLPNPVCLAHGIEDPCPECARTSKRDGRLFIIAPVVVVLLFALWLYTWRVHLVCTVGP